MFKAIRKGSSFRLTWRLMIATMAGVFFCLGEPTPQGLRSFTLMETQPVSAQSLRPQDAWRQVYERLPDLPLENNYVSNETGEVDADNTLVSRLIRYHLYVKSRPPNYRFDWKLTMADYLGAHERLVESQYPGHQTLQENPMEGDREVIETLTRAERNALVDALVSVFRPSGGTPSESTPSESPPSTPPNPRTGPLMPKPGDAQLLMP